MLFDADLVAYGTSYEENSCLKCQEEAKVQAKSAPK